MKTVDQTELQPNLQTKTKEVSPVVTGAAEALAKQHKKSRRVIELEAPPDIHEGVHLMPNWREFDILRIREDRDYRVLFTRGVSAHDVSFGLADLRSPQGLKTVPVAIKPFNNQEFLPDKNACKAMEDAIANGWVLQRGFTTTDPIAVIRADDSFIVSPVKPGVQALDTEPWHQFSTGDLKAREHFIQRLEQVAKILAALNFSGINHVDSQLRNYWTTPDGTIEPFDWESAKVLGNPPTPEELLRIAASSLRPLYKNLELGNKAPKQPVGSNPIPILRGDERVFWSQFSQYILEPYVQKLEDLFLGSNNDELLGAVTAQTLTATLKEHLGQRD